MLPLVLASTSRYRRELLERLRLPFSTSPPATDETPLPNESAEALVRRLAEAKARALSELHPAHLIIGSDQVAVLGNQILGKPHDFSRARSQLMAASGASVTFLTGLALLNSASGHCQVDLVPFTVHFRALDEEQISRYLQAEQPYDCAGSFKAEGLGITLFDAIESRDPTALIGLPLIRTCRLMRTAGVKLL